MSPVETLTMTQATATKIQTADTVQIAARQFPATSQPKAAVIIAPAMGVNQDFYAPLATWLTTQQITTYTFDYRGTGASKPRGTLKGYKATITDWANKDCAAIIDHVHAQHPDLPVLWLGHSVGAQIVGMIPNHKRLTAMLSIAAGSGYHRYNAPPLRHYVLALWYAIAPISLRLAGYFPGKKLGVIGDLPAGVMTQWRKWCLSPDYLGCEGPHMRDQLASVELPITAWSMRDDEMMTLTGTKALFALYTRAQLEIVSLDPARHGVHRIGHFGFFRQQSGDALWPLLSQWIERTLQPQAAEPRVHSTQTAYAQ
jgi:predicted alpha/beta hydrolase